MAEVKSEKAKTLQLPQRCAEKVKRAQLRSDVNMLPVLGQTKTLDLGKNSVYADCTIHAMAVHPHGLFVSVTLKNETRNVIIPSVNFSYYELADE